MVPAIAQAGKSIGNKRERRREEDIGDCSRSPLVGSGLDLEKIEINENLIEGMREGRVRMQPTLGHIPTD